MRFNNLFPLLFAISLSPVSVADISDSDWVRSIVEQNYPQQLEDDYEGGAPFVGRYQFMVADGAGSGTLNIFAIYSNGEDVRLSVFDSEGVLVFEQAGLKLMWGGALEISAVDFDGDGRSEIFVDTSGAFTANTPSFQHVLRWDGTVLELISPQENGITTLSNAYFDDLENDGVFEILNPTEAAEGVFYDYRYQLINDSFEVTEVIFFDQLFRSVDGQPKVTDVVIPPQDPSVLHKLIVRNGSESGNFRAIFFGIELETTTLVPVGEIDDSVEVFTDLVDLKGESQLLVATVGAPDSWVTVTLSALIDAPVIDPPIDPETVDCSQLVDEGVYEQGAARLSGSFTYDGVEYEVSYPFDSVSYGTCGTAYIQPQEYEQTITPSFSGAGKLVNCFNDLDAPRVVGVLEPSSACMWMAGALMGTFPLDKLVQVATGDVPQNFLGYTPSGDSIDGDVMLEGGSVTVPISVPVDLVDYRNGDSHKARIVGPGPRIDSSSWESSGVVLDSCEHNLLDPSSITLIAGVSPSIECTWSSVSGENGTVILK